MSTFVLVILLAWGVGSPFAILGLLWLAARRWHPPPVTLVYSDGQPCARRRGPMATKRGGGGDGGRAS